MIHFRPFHTNRRQTYVLRILQLLFVVSNHVRVQCFSFSTASPKRRLIQRLSNQLPFTPTKAQNEADWSLKLSRISSTSSKQLQIALGKSHIFKYYPFTLDDWQYQAAGAILQGHHVMVCAPTGSGKTVVGELALQHAIETANELKPGVGFYTTPLKALSNQKYYELSTLFPNTTIGLSTGDISLHTDTAPIAVLTTEVYRNRAARGDLDSCRVVVLDEFHYMGLVSRGSVWEESVILTAYLESIQIIVLSATLSNARDLAQWVQDVSGKQTTLIDSTKRAVPLSYHFATQNVIHPLFQNPKAGPGAADGMLGWGFKNNKKGFDMEECSKPRLPKGLQANPALKAVAAKRQQAIQRRLKRQDEQWRFKRLSGIRPTVGRRPHQGECLDSIGEERLLRQELRRTVPKLPNLVKLLEKRDMLPAIVFLFSRVGCDEAASSLRQALLGEKEKERWLPLNGHKGKYKEDKDEVDREEVIWSKKRATMRDRNGRQFRPSSNLLIERGNIAFTLDLDPLSPSNWMHYSRVGLLSLEQVEATAARVKTFQQDCTEEVALSDKVVQQLLLGIGSHHAGLLPSQKSLVENLFQSQLMRVVFATETLAAGLNMPARTAVIVSLAKREDTGLKLLKTSNLLQMAGRAGRRGMDDEGRCVICATAFETHTDAIRILTDPIAPTRSQFRPSYSLVLNLIIRSSDGRLDMAQQLIDKSFAAWEKKEKAKDQRSQETSLDTDLVALTRTLVTYGCLEVLTGTLLDVNAVLNCTFFITRAGRDLSVLSFDNSLWAFVALGGTFAPTGANDFNASTPNADSEELVHLLRGLSPAEIAGYVACFATDARSNSLDADLLLRTSSGQRRVIKKALDVLDRLIEVQKVNGVSESLISSCRLDVSNCQLVTGWASGRSWSQVLDESGGGAPGDVARTLSRVLDALRQFGNLEYIPVRLRTAGVNLHPDIRKACQEAAFAINRFPVKDPLCLEVVLPDGEDVDLR